MTDTAAGAEASVVLRLIGSGPCLTCPGQRVRRWSQELTTSSWPPICRSSGSLRAKPLARDYWTLSVWKDNTALRDFMRTSPHIQLMTSLKPYMGPTKFVTWTISVADGRPGMSL